MSKELQKISQLDFIRKLEKKKQVLDKNRPLSKDLENRIFQKLKLDWNFNSNAIEGNTFTHGETVALLMEGITAKGKPLKDALDIKGHNDAIQFMLDMIKGERDLNENDIRSLHKIILGTQYENPSITSSGNTVGKKVAVGSYKTMPNHVLTSTGETHYYATPEETPAKMTELVSWYNKNAKLEEINPVVLAAIFHHKFVEIHPFDDGNGRMTRILTNFILMKFGYPIAVVKNENKKNYYAALSQADTGQILPFVELMSETINHSLAIYIKGLNGEDINDPDDLDKEIELFRKEIGVKTKVEVIKNEANLEKIVYDIFIYSRPKLNKFVDLFDNITEVFSRKPGFDVSFNPNMNIDFNSFKTSVKLNNQTTHLSYKFNFNQDIFSKNIDTGFYVHFNFKTKYYYIVISETKILKYYDEEVLDENIKLHLNNRFKLLMNSIKSKLQ